MDDLVGPVGIVIIGRNEGAKLEEVFGAVKHANCPIIYVDSDSSDNSLQIAKSQGIETLSLQGVPNLNASKARNAGYRKLIEKHPSLQFIQFLDGDCTLINGWVSEALNLIQQRIDVAIICGTLAEKNHHISNYKLLSSLEWKAPIGEVLFTGGNFLIRKSSFEQVGQWDEDIIAAEDNVICHKIRQAGWKILRANVKMAVHDSSIVNFYSFWNRCVRTGYAFAQVASKFGHENHNMFTREVRSTIIFGGIIPLLILVCLFWNPWISLALLSAYLALFVKIYIKLPGDWSQSESLIYAASCVISKFPGFYGILKYYLGL